MITQEVRVALVALRHRHIPLYMEVLSASVESRQEFEAEREAVGVLSEQMDEETPDITAIVRGDEYRAFVMSTGEADASLADRMHRVLTELATEQRLRKLKESDFDEYLRELHTLTEEDIADALRNGTIVNAFEDDGRPMAIRHDERVSGAFLDDPTATAVVDAGALTRVLGRFASGGEHGSPAGLRLNRVVVRGILNLNYFHCPFPVGFEGCEFHGWVWADSFEAPQLTFDTCTFAGSDHKRPNGTGAFNADGCSIEGQLKFNWSIGLKQLFIPDARIGYFEPLSTEQLTGTDTKQTRLEVGGVRIEIGGASIGTLVIPQLYSDGDSSSEDGEEFVGLTVGRSVRINKLYLEGLSDAHIAERLANWLERSDGAEAQKSDKSDETTAIEEQATDSFPPPEVWSEFEGAIKRSGWDNAAKEFGILAAAKQADQEGFKGKLKKLFLGPTVRYFYDNTRAIWYLIGLLGLTWLTALIVALVDPHQLVQSPLANPAVVPDHWLTSFVNKLVWSFMYAVDIVLSPLSLGQAETIWPTSVWLSLLFAIYKGLSILFLGLFIIGITGLAEKRSRS